MDCESNKHNESETQDELFDWGLLREILHLRISASKVHGSRTLVFWSMALSRCAHYGYAGNFPHAVYNWIFYPPGVTHVTIWNLDINIRVEYVDWRPGVISWAWLSR